MSTERKFSPTAEDLLRSMERYVGNGEDEARTLRGSVQNLRVLLATSEKERAAAEKRAADAEERAEVAAKAIDSLRIDLEGYEFQPARELAAELREYPEELLVRIQTRISRATVLACLDALAKLEEHKP